MAVDLRAKLREFMDSLGADDEAADEVETEAADTDAAEADAVDEVEQAGDGADNAAEAEADDADETIPESEVNESQLRDSLNTLAAENESLRATNEALRTRLAELGGESEVDADAVEVDEVEAEADDEPYDDEAATLDLEKQRAEIASLMGTAN